MPSALGNLTPVLFFSTSEMATAAFKNHELQIVHLADADLTGLERLFDAQCDEWLSLLRWDYTGPSRLIREVARQRELAGFVAMSGRATVGFSFYVIEGDRCSIGDLYVAKQWRGKGADTQMATAILDGLERTPRLRRVESQCVGVGNDDASELFKASGFECFDRHYMMADLRSAAGAGSRRSGELLDLSLRPWRDDDFAQAARVIHRSYRGEHDSRINSQYRTEEGCADLLSILTDHIWCGDFLPQVSRVALDTVTGNHVGVLIASRIAVGTGHIGQISVLPSHQGLGIGRRMLRAAMSEFARLGFEKASLAVTRANAGAYHLYQSCGFRTAHKFPVFYRESRQ